MALANRGVRRQSIANRKHALIIVIATFVFAVGCAQQPERGSAAGASQPYALDQHAGRGDKQQNQSLACYGEQVFNWAKSTLPNLQLPP
jgi:hypothetical protein